MGKKSHDAKQPPVDEPTPDAEQNDQPKTEADLTHGDGNKTHSVPAGSADATADATADSPNNGTENTHPQSPNHDGELSASDKAAIAEAAGQAGAVVSNIAAQFKITPERVLEIIDDEAHKSRGDSDNG
jgi:hypothetical protein